MHQGEHGLTAIEMPDGSILYSRDVHVRAKPQCVVEIMGVGKFFVRSSSNSYSRVEEAAEKDKIAGVELKRPYLLNRIKVASGEFSLVETDFRYQPGVELRSDEDEAQPTLRVEFGIPEWIQAPLREASSLRAEVEAVAAGPCYGPDALKRFTIFTARIAVVWSLIDSQLFQFTHQVRFVWPGLDTDSISNHSKTIRAGTEALTALSHLLAALDHLNPPGVHCLSHVKVREGVRLQSETLAKMLQLLAPEAENRVAEANWHLSGNPDRYDRDRDLGRGVNEIQAGRTQLCFAFNRAIGQYWNMVEEVKNPLPLFRCIIQPAPYSPEAERHTLAELGNLFLRHRGNRLAVLHFQMQDGGGA